MDLIPNVLKAVRRVLHPRNSRVVELHTKPVPASRPRVSKWGTYYGKTYTAFRKDAERLLEKVTGETDAPLAVITELVVPRPKTSCRLYPRGDNDNFEKAVWDSITSCPGIWKDDDQIVFNVTYKRFCVKKEEPGILLEIYELNP